MPNKLKTAWQAGKATVNGWAAIPSGFAAEMYSRAGWDSVTVDMQHGIQDYLSCVSCFQGMQPSGVVPMVRVPWNEPGIIGKVLDAGAYGIICPMINTEAEAKAFVQYGKYPPRGTRSNGPIRAAVYGEAGAYQTTANDEILMIPMIETKKAIDNIGAILDVPGIDAIYIGPSDLSFSLGKTPKLDVEDDEIFKIYEMLLKETGKRNIAAGIHCGVPAYAKRMIKMGFKLVTIANDVGIMLNAAKAAVTETKS
ncbi:5-keto-4-deoxy-D-glucarate aldolase [Variibacter gotjawalensis]|uniref:5-keto-4-deoxy-D-glucarate aldolase n=1 Tax=Variibacter gotjawalensis TaxID=1333996 RepID=A0A0S3Q1F6_9BRAD|nr:aldolase/citrate lyase family protein [Variibacter gotjawalensis]NIK47648.1 4-hydroxy-2-oxoheptanedioate aldolase [Variibacter gotjawalensis]RZS49545.1 4-hydroxy-2-oxoheptanedioate aldolase [Variibacter gotjawalensis]BAT61808.1 5-keto-4-deoxy-D-glucarate aldolase [Variibacter gotjawalensis]